MTSFHWSRHGFWPQAIPTWKKNQCWTNVLKVHMYPRENTASLLNTCSSSGIFLEQHAATCRVYHQNRKLLCKHTCPAIQLGARVIVHNVHIDSITFLCIHVIQHPIGQSTSTGKFAYLWNAWNDFCITKTLVISHIRKYSTSVQEKCLYKQGKTMTTTPTDHAQHYVPTLNSSSDTLVPRAVLREATLWRENNCLSRRNNGTDSGEVCNKQIGAPAHDPLDRKWQ